jgi:acyl-CoA synthetase (AMP-forming)/AMP-acid ligase II
VFFLGRLKETLRIGHQMVAPAEIEAFLAHPGPARPSWSACPTRDSGVPVAYVIPRPGAAPTGRRSSPTAGGSSPATRCRARLRRADVPRTPSPHGDKVQQAGFARARSACGGRRRRETG